MDALRKLKEAGKLELYPDVNLRCTYSEMRCICTCFRNRGCVIEETHLMENIIYNELRIRGYHVDDGFHPNRLAGCSYSRSHHDEGYGRGVNHIIKNAEPPVSGGSVFHRALHLVYATDFSRISRFVCASFFLLEGHAPCSEEYDASEEDGAIGVHVAFVTGLRSAGCAEDSAGYRSW